MCLLQGRPKRRGEGLSSSSSNYTPLQLGQGGRGMTRGHSGGNRGGGGGSGGSSRTASDHSAFLGQSSEMTHSVKLIDKNWHWEDKAMDVRDKSMYRIDTCRYNFYGSMYVPWIQVFCRTLRWRKCMTHYPIEP